MGISNTQSEWFVLVLGYSSLAIRFQWLIDGACGFECMTAILKNMGYSLKYVDGTSNTTTYILTYDNSVDIEYPKELRI